MLCTRCSHPLSARADRCLRCFALNPQNVPPPAARVAAAAPRAAVPAAEVSMSMVPEPLAAVTLSIDSEPPEAAGARALSIASDPPAAAAPFAATPQALSIDSDPPVVPATAPGGPRADAHRAATLRADAPRASPLRPATQRADAPRAAPLRAGAPRADTVPSPLPMPLAGPAAPSPLARDISAAAWSMAPAVAAAATPAGPAAALEPAWTLRAPAPRADPRDAAADRHEAVTDPRDAVADAHDAVTDPPDAGASLPASLRAPRACAPPDVSTPASRFAVGPSAPTSAMPSAAVPSAAVPSAAEATAALPSRRARLLAWAVDLALLSACAAAHVWLATALLGGPARLAPHGTGSPDYWLDLLLAPRLPLLWTALAACLAVAYSWLFATLGGRTPGLLLARLRLVDARGAVPSPAASLVRAALSLASAAGLLGFALALVDERGQTLHDKLTGTRVVPA